VADIKISDLPSASALAGTEVFPVVQSSTTRQATIDQIASLLNDSASTGLLSARPAAASVTDGYLYFASDDDGGTLYVSDGSAWTPVAPSINTTNAGVVLAAAEPSSIAAINTVAATPVRIPEMTTGSFTMPAGRVRFYLSGGVLLGVTSGTTFEVRATTDGWATNQLCGTYALTRNAIIGEEFFAIAGVLPPVGGTAISAGATVQVALFVTRAGVNSVTLWKSVSDGINPFLHVIAG
jgi:hypothetical protein